MTLLRISFFADDGIRSNDVEITESQTRDDDGKLITDSRITREVKSTDSNKQTIRYDIIKTFMEVLDNVEIEQDATPLSLGEKMVINTMGNYGLIKEIGK